MDLFSDHIIALSTMALLLLTSAFFSGTETALFSLTRSKVRQLRREGGHVEKTLALLSDNPTGLLISLLFGNLVVNILFFSTSVVIASDIGRRYGEWWEACVGAVVLLLVILGGEILPKSVGITYSERVVRIGSIPLRNWYHFLSPVRRLLQRVAEYLEPSDQHDNRLNAEELKMLIDATRHDSTFGRQEKAIVEDIVNLPEIRLRELMVPRVRQHFRRADTPAAEAMASAAEQEIGLLPVYEGDEDNVIGVVEVCDLFSSNEPNRALRDFVQPIPFVPETKCADEMLREFLSDGHRMVFVVDEYGGLAGTVCMEDLLEEVVGEFDALEVPPVEQLGESTYRLQGSLSVREWRNLFIGFLPEEVVRTLALDTVSGLVVSLLKRMPRPGDVTRVGNLSFTVEQVRSRRIETVLLDLTDSGGAL